MLIKASRILAACVLLAAAVWTVRRLWPRTLHVVVPPAILPRPEFEGGQVFVRRAGLVTLAHVGTFHDELLAYLHFDYLRTRPLITGHLTLLTVSISPSDPVYRIYVVPPPRLQDAVAFLMRLAAEGYIQGFELMDAADREVTRHSRQTDLFIAAYNRPLHRKLEKLRPNQLLAPMRRLLVFKSRTDRRVRRKIEPVPEVLTRIQAQELAADIIAVTEFYKLPLDFFLGIGAMENNYMDVRGDLKHAVWKRSAEKGDVVLRRAGGRVLVSNYSIGVWQITRKTLRLAHRLCLADDRDYSRLPERLRPAREMDFKSLEDNPRVLTTYAGRLFRYLLDQFDGDVEKAVGAYNGGVGRPNMRYSTLVESAAQDARRVLEQAAALHGRRVADSVYVSALPRRARQRG